VTGTRQVLDQHGLELETGMVRSEIHAHGENPAVRTLVAGHRNRPDEPGFYDE
jgi:hypothetical protein